MRCFLFVAIVAVASVAWADNLPPVPKTISVPVTAIIKAPERVEPARTPTVEPTTARDAKVETTKEAPMPPVPATTACSQYEKGRHPLLSFLVNELLRKPIHKVREAFNELEARRLCHEERRLDAEAERVACRIDELAQNQPRDLYARLRLLIEQKDCERMANNLAVKRAALDCKEAKHHARTEKLKGCE